MSQALKSLPCLVALTLFWASGAPASAGSYRAGTSPSFHGRGNPISSSPGPKDLRAACGGCHPEKFRREGLVSLLPSLSAVYHNTEDPSRAYRPVDCEGCHGGQGAHRGGLGTHGAAGGECVACHVHAQGRHSLLGRFHGGGALLGFLDVLLIALSVGICVAGFLRARLRYLRGRPEARKGRVRHVLAYLIAHRRILRDRRAGIAHLLVFWGFAITLLLTVLAEFRVVLPFGLAGVTSVVRDLAGLGALLGVGYFLVRLGFRRRREAEERAIPALLLLLAVLLTGFLAAGIRLSTVGTEPLWWSPVGRVVSLASPGSPILLQFTVRLHFVLVAVLVALLPFTPLRHLWATLVNVYYRGGSGLTEVTSPPLGRGLLGARAPAEFSWKHLLDAEACTSCGRCDASCPASRAGKPLHPRTVVLALREPLGRAGEGNLESDPVWSCTTCGACNFECPAEVDIVGKVIELRRRGIDKGEFPLPCHSVLESMTLRGNPWLMDREERTLWMDGLDASARTSRTSAEWLYWVGCTSSYVSAAQPIVRATVSLLGRAGMECLLLGSEERCCGEPARRIGEEGLFQELCRKNIERLNERGVKKIVTHCPHCYHVFKNEYPALGGRYEIHHHTELLARLAKEGRLGTTGGKAASVFMQDACYLTRYNGLSRCARDLVERAAPGRLLEGMRPDQSLCCGGGGGQPWLDAGPGPRLEDVRLEEILRLKPELIATACPFCKVMLESAADSLDAATHRPPVKDVAELLLECT